MSDNVRRFTCFKYFQDLLHPCFTDVKSIEAGIEETKGVEDIKVG